MVDMLDDTTIEKVLEDTTDFMKDLLAKVDNRWIPFNNRNPTGDERQKLLETISIMLACNDGRHYSSSIYTTLTTRLQAYGSGNMYSLRGLADNKAVMLVMVSGVIIPALCLGYVAGGIALASCFATKGYEYMMGPKK